MKELTYNFVDKSKWQRGEWDNEFDKIQYADKKTGLPCLIVRHHNLGHFCGYVGVDKTHPFFGVDYSSCSIKGAKPKGRTKGDTVARIGEKVLPLPSSMVKISRKRIVCPQGEDYCDHRPESWLNVHGGITFSEKCRNDEHGICHKVEAGEDDNIWWFGFDCAHAGDYSPGHSALIGAGLFKGDTYKNVAYLKSQVAKLAQQLNRKEALLKHVI